MMATAIGSTKSKDSKAITVFVAGKGGSGRSTLINSILGVERRWWHKSQSADERHTVFPVANDEMKIVENKIGDVNVCMRDAPSLMSSGRVKHGKPWYYFENITDIVDLCLFCVDVSKLRFDEELSEAMKELHKILGKDIWKKTLFVLTFANKYILRIEDNFRSDPEGMKQKFDCQIKSWKKKLRQILDKEVPGVDPGVAPKIDVVPVGDRHSHQLLSNDKSTWLIDLWGKANGVVGPTAKKAVEKILEHLHHQGLEGHGAIVPDTDSFSQDGCLSEPYKANIQGMN